MPVRGPGMLIIPKWWSVLILTSSRSKVRQSQQISQAKYHYNAWNAKIIPQVLGGMEATATITATQEIPNWRVKGDWFDVCMCNIPCPCEFAQTPTYGDCDGIFAYNIKKGNHGETCLDGLNVLAPGSFKGNIWAGDGKTKVKWSGP
ncbi:MAG: DUF1326 domain-containing protein [Nitrososphaeraceae archaeon]|jgi:hypothetical protein